MKKTVLAIATMDTKGQELQFVQQRLQDAGIHVRLVNVGTLGEPTVTPDISSREVLAGRTIATRDRGAAVTQMGEALRAYLPQVIARDEIAGVIGIGGSGGTALISTAMQALPIGLPKIIVSTVASGNTSAYVDCSDITMMFSVVDVAGLNVVSEKVLSNAAHALAGMVNHSHESDSRRRTLGMTMFGVTTPCVTAVREILEAEGTDCLVFHATGTGGRAMEKLVASGMIEGVLDITTTEIADEIAGGVFTAGPTRFDILLEQKIPLLVSFGAVDMVNFGAKETVPTRFKNRKLHVHNSQVTLMRTTVEENQQIAKFLAEKLNRAEVPVTVVMPEGGVSALDAPGQPFHDPEADAALFDRFESRWNQSSGRRLVRSPLHINDPEFARLLVTEFQEVCR